MSFSELYGFTRGKNKSSRQGVATCSAEPHSQPDSDFVELVWENGQVVIQGQTNKTRKPTSDNISTEGLLQNTRLINKGLVKNDDAEMGMGRVGMTESAMNDFHIPVPTELDEHDEMVPWLKYHMSDNGPVQHNYGSDFYTELSGVNAHNLLSHGNNITVAGRRCPGALAINGLHPVPVQNAIDFEHRNGIPTRPEGSQSDQLSMHQSICLFPSFRSKASDIDRNCLHNSNQQLLLCDPAKKDSVYPRMKMHTQDPAQQLPTSTIMNFSHFSKHSVVKSSPNTISSKAAPEVSTKEMDGMEIGSVPTAAKQADPLQVASSTGQQRNSRYHTQIGALSTLDGSKMTTSKPLSANHPDLISCQYSRKNGMPPIKLVSDGNAVTGNVEKTVEPPNVVSSVCSGNSVDRASNDPTCGLKRKYSEFEDSEYRSEDIEEDSVGIRKGATNRLGSGSKRSRAAEVHNLSERRRRDRINEKMRALQELIPNCNKVDKASMLDEAIEYLKTLQLQVQMMSIGPGLCMPQMMLSHAAHMPARFSSMSVGMGMGYGLGMLDMNGNPSNYQLVQMPSVPGTRFPLVQAPGFCNLNATPLPNHPVYGFQGQGIGTPVTCPPAISYTADPPIRPVMDLNTLSSVLPVVDLSSGQTSHIIDAVQDATLEEPPKTDHNID